MPDNKLRNRVKLYLESKFTISIFDDFPKKHKLYFTIRGVNAPMWKQVIKPELERLAADYDHALIMHVEKPTNKFLEFEFTALRASLPPLAPGDEPPLTNAEIRIIRDHIKMWEHRTSDRGTFL